MSIESGLQAEENVGGGAATVAPVRIDTGCLQCVEHRGTALQRNLAFGRMPAHQDGHLAKIGAIGSCSTIHGRSPPAGHLPRPCRN